MGAADAGAAAPPPEQEERREFETPRAGARYVYVANTRRDTVAVIDSTNLAIRSVEVGDAPGFLATVAGKDIAVTLNVGSADATILRTEAGATRTSTVPTVRGANRLDIAPDGRYAVAWYAADGAVSPVVTGNFQEVSVLALTEPPTSFRLTVGFRPQQVVFAQDGTTGFVITEDGISVVRFADLRGPAVAPLVRMGTFAMNVAGDVSITPDGKHALGRVEGSSTIELVDLATGTSTTADLGSPVTDLDLAPTGGFALAVLRDSSTVVRLPIPAGFTSEAQRTRQTLPGESFGSASLTGDGKTAVLYTTATPVERLVVLDLVGGSARPVRLKKSVRAVALAPDGKSALVVHKRTTPAVKQSDVETGIDAAFGYSVVDLTTGFAKLQLTDADVGPLAITPDGTRAFVLLRDDARSLRLAQRVHLSSFLVDDFALGSPPLSVAALADSKRIFVSQVHPEGRISFIHWETGAVESVTGFELNGRIVL